MFKNRNLKNVCLVLRDYTFRYQWSLTALDGTFANMTILIEGKIEIRHLLTIDQLMSVL